MADTKISALPASTTPLAGTEVLPIVQSSATKQVSVANLTAGRSFDALGMTLTSTDAGAAAAPLLELYRDSASPAANDTLGEIEFNGEDSAGNKQAYALFHGSILSPTSGSEQGQLHFETATAGALTEKMIIGTTNLVINEIGAIFNVRIEGDTDANLFYTDATNSRVGVGTISPSSKFEVAGDARVTSGNLIIGTSTQGVTSGNFALGLGANGSTSAVSIDTSGNLLVETTSVIQSGRYSCSFAGNLSNGIVLQTTFASTGTDFVRCVNSAGTAIGNITQNGATTVAYNTSSDYRLKNTITAMTGALAKVALLKPVTYKWNADGSNGEGFIAHELAEVCPDAVSGAKDALDADGKPKYQGIDTSFLVATLTAAIQEQQALIIQLQADVAALKGA
jgi:hypothetical protein